MKRGRKPRGFNTHKVSKEMHDTGKQKIQNLGPSLADLPRPICFDILLRLPTSRLLICRCVCKTWRKLISNPEFAKLHFLQAEAFPIIRSLSPIHISRNLYLVEPPERCPGFDLPVYCDSFGEYVSGMKLETKLKIPLHNAELVMNNGSEANVNCNPKGGVKRKRCIKLRPKNHKLNLVNSCNGFLCLSEPSLNDPVVVCNPFTGEFINHPVPTQARECSKSFSDCGLGFSPKTNQYKVIRMFDQQQQIRERICEPITGRETFSARVAEIHTLGTGSWRRIGCAPSSRFAYMLRFPTYLNGSLHWLLVDNHVSNYIISFDFDKERFQLVPPPPLKEGKISLDTSLATMKNMSLGVLRGSLCICYCPSFEDIHIWVMEKYGVLESWRELFCIFNRTRGLFEPLSYLSSGAILFFNRLGNVVVYYTLDKGYMSRNFLKVRGITSKYKAFAYTPSFISLKDAVTGENLEVLNITSRRAGFKLLGETKALFLRKVDEQTVESDFETSSDIDY